MAILPSSKTSTPHLNPQNDFTLVALALALTIVMPFAADSYLPSLPAMAHIFNSTATTMQLTVTLYLLGVSLSQLVYGPFSDKHGRRPLILIGLAIAVFGSIICAAATTPTMLIVGRFIQGAGAGACNSLFRALMRDSFSGTRLAKISSYLGTIFSVAPALAPILGGYIQASLGWRSNFIFLVGFIASIGIILWRFLPETNKNLNPQATRRDVIIKNYVTILSNKSFLGHTICSSLAFSGIIAYSTVSPFLFQTVLGFSPVAYGWLALVICLGLMLSQFGNGRLLTYFSLQALTVVGLSLMVTGGLLMFFIGLTGILNMWVVIIPTFIFITGGGLVFSNAMAGAFHPFEKMAGAAGAMYGCLQILGTFIVSLIVSTFHIYNQMPLAAIFVILGGLSGIFYHLFVLRDLKKLSLQN